MGNATALNATTNKAIQLIEETLDYSKDATKAFTDASYGALDEAMDLLGLARPAEGTAARNQYNTGIRDYDASNPLFQSSTLTNPLSASSADISTAEFHNLDPNRLQEILNPISGQQITMANGERRVFYPASGTGDSYDPYKYRYLNNSQNPPGKRFDTLAEAQEYAAQSQAEGFLGTPVNFTTGRSGDQHFTPGYYVNPTRKINTINLKQDVIDKGVALGYLNSADATQLRAGVVTTQNGADILPDLYNKFGGEQNFNRSIALTAVEGKINGEPDKKLDARGNIIKPKPLTPAQQQAKNQNQAKELKTLLSPINLSETDPQHTQEEALNRLAADPGYQFQVRQANQGLLRAQAATGSLASGNTLDALSRLNQDLASTKYNERLNQLQQIIAPGTGLLNTNITNTTQGGTAQSQLKAAQGQTQFRSEFNTALGGQIMGVGQMLMQQGDLKGAANVFGSLGSLSL